MFAYHLWRDMVLGIFINILEEDASVFFNEFMETKLKWKWTSRSHLTIQNVKYSPELLVLKQLDIKMGKDNTKKKNLWTDTVTFMNINAKSLTNYKQIESSSS